MASGGERDAYVVLGVGRDADDETIATAYRALARRFHPDIAGGAATRRMMRINAAFDAIRTADLRAEYEDTASARTADIRSTPGTQRADTRRPGDLHSAPRRDGTGGAGPPPGRPSGSVLDFGRHVGWSLGEIARVDPGYLDWLTEKREGRPFLQEINATLQHSGYRPEPTIEQDRGRRRGLFRRG